MPESSKPMPTPKKVPMKAVTKAQKDSNKGKCSHKENYSVCVCPVLKQVHPDTGISSKAVGLMNSFVNIFKCIAGQASCLVPYNQHLAMTSQEIQKTMHLLVPRELAKHTMSEGTEAVTESVHQLQMRVPPRS